MSQIIYFLRLYLFVQSIMGWRDGWKCFDHGRKTVTYKDTGNPVPLPTYKTFSGDWNSILLTNWIARIILTEKMGVDFEYYCTGEDYSLYWECDNNYPFTTWDVIQAGKTDINLEAYLHASKLVGHLQRVYNGKIIDYGPNGITQVALLYTADYDQSWTLGNWKSLKDLNVRTAVLNAMKPIFDSLKMHGSLYTFEEWKEPGVFKQGTIATIASTASTLLTKAPIFCAGPTWVSTRLLQDKIYKQGLGNYWQLWATQTEVQLSEILDMAGAAEKHFVAQFWEPSYDMASYEKQRIAWRVPFEKGCSQNATCDSEAEFTFKVASPSTINKIPEVRTFFERFALPGNRDMSEMIYRKQKGSLTFKEMACEWVKNNEGEWSGFVTDIVRFEKSKPWWAIWVQIGALVVGGGFLVFISWRLWICLGGKERGALSEAGLDKKWRNEAMMEIGMNVLLLIMDCFDVCCTCWSTATCFGIAGDRLVYIIGFCLVLVIEVGYAAFIGTERLKMMREAMNKLRGSWMDDPRFAKHAEENVTKESTVLRITSMLKKDQERSRYKMELLNLLAAIGEDVPCICLYIALFMEGFIEDAFILGCLFSCTMLGYKLCAVEKMWMWSITSEFDVLKKA